MQSITMACDLAIGYFSNIINENKYFMQKTNVENDVGFFND